MTELQIQSAIREHLEGIGWLCVLNTQARRGAHKGRGDLSCFGPKGRYVEIEIKSKTGKLRPEQIDFQANLNLRGHTYLIARSVGDVEEALKC